MTKEEQKELLSDLCSRLPYGVKCAVHNDSNIYRLSGVVYGKPYSKLYFEELDWKECDGFEGIQYCKPYLFPMSSMTEEQRKEYEDAITYHGYIDGGWTMVKDFANEYVVPYWFVDFCNKNHLDYRGWINVGLVIDATGKNIY